MIIYRYTDKEQAELDALYAWYSGQLEKCDREHSEKLKPLHPVSYGEDGVPVFDREQLKAYTEAPEYKAWRNQWADIISRHASNLYEFNQRAEQRQFSELNGDPEKVKEDAKRQAEALINNRVAEIEEKKASGNRFSFYWLRVDGRKLWIDTETTTKDCEGLLKRHYDFFSGDPVKINQIREAVAEVIRASPHTGSTGELFAMTKGRGERIEAIQVAPGGRPTEWKTAIDKVSGLAFDGEGTLYGEALRQVSVGKKGGQMLTLISLANAELSEPLTAYERAVHDAVATLCMCGNEFITTRQIYFCMTGNKDKPAEKQRQQIVNAMWKMNKTDVRIFASQEEAALYGCDRLEYDGAVLQFEVVTAEINGSVTECFHILREPVLCENARNKGQVTGMPMQFLNTPVKKNDENIVLQTYLQRRILVMKNASKGKKISKVIRLEAVYREMNTDQLDGEARRQKEKRIRRFMRQILDAWKAEKFIKDYAERLKGNKKIDGIEIIL